MGHDNLYKAELMLVGRCVAQVRADKQREVRNGHDGTWVAHPALVGIAKQIFDEGMSSPNQVLSSCTCSASHFACCSLGAAVGNMKVSSKGTCRKKLELNSRTALVMRPGSNSM